MYESSFYLKMNGALVAWTIIGGRNTQNPTNCKNNLNFIYSQVMRTQKTLQFSLSLGC